MSCAFLEAFVRFEKHPLLLKKRALYLLIFGVFVLLCVFFFRRRCGESILRVKVVPVSSVRRVEVSPVVFDSESYYRLIIENNLFRPLGWSPPVRVEPYRLIGTRIVRDGVTPAQAILQTTAGHQTYIVGVGDPLDASTEVVGISERSVVLSTGGRQRTLALARGVWLKPSDRSSVVSPRRSVRPSSVRNRRTVSPVRSSASPRQMEKPGASSKFSAWETVEGEVLRVGDARLKNPAKWGLRRRFPGRSFDEKK